MRPRSDLCMFTFVELLDLVLGEREGRKGTLLPLFVCVVVGDRIREQTAIASAIYPPNEVTRPGYRSVPSAPFCSVWFLGENGVVGNELEGVLQLT